MGKLILPPSIYPALEPNLLVPNEKPKGLVELNTNTSLRRGLKIAIPILGRDPNPRCLVTKHEFSVYSGNTSRKPEGIYSTAYSTTSYLRDESYNFLADFCSTACTVLAIFDIGSTGVSNEQVLFRADSQVSLALFPALGKVRCLMPTTGTTGWTGGHDFTTSGIESNKKHVLGFRWDGSVKQNLFNEEIQSGQTVTGSFNPLGNQYTTINGNVNAGTYSLDNGSVFAVFAWDRSLSDAEYFSFVHNPYQILESAYPPLILDTTESPASGFFARRYYDNFLGQN